MGNFSLDFLQTGYAKVQTDYATAVLPTNTSAFRFESFSLDENIKSLIRTDKTGSRTKVAGLRGRTEGVPSKLKWTLNPNGTPGTVPDHDPFYVATMGQVGTVTTATTGNGFPSGTTVISAAAAVKYALSDSIPCLSVYDYNQPSTIDQLAGLSTTVVQMMLSFGGDFSMVDCDLDSAACVRSNQFGAALTEEKRGLGSFPTEPSAPVVNGPGVVGFLGLALIAGTTIGVGLQTGSVTIKPNNIPNRKSFGFYTAQFASGAPRDVMTELKVYEDDSAGYTALIAAARAKTPIDAVYQFGTTPGAMVVVHVKGIQFNTPTRAQSDQLILSSFANSPATGSGNRTEVTIWFV